MGTQLYNNSKQKIYPITEASSVTCTEKDSVQTAITDLYTQVSTLSGEADAANNIIVDVMYVRTDSKDESYVKELGSWSSTFVLPNDEYPYVWKRTKYTYNGDTQNLNTVYEIVATNLYEKIQNIYIAQSTQKAPEIVYDDEDDLTQYDDKLPDGWTETPVSISAARPYAFMSTRKRIEGKWTKFSDPAQFGRWAFDSKLEIRYQVTDSDVPNVDNKSDNPGDGWTTESITDFTGKLWMITATSVNGVINSDDDQTRWQGPYLIGYVK